MAKKGFHFQFHGSKMLCCLDKPMYGHPLMMVVALQNQSGISNSASTTTASGPWTIPQPYPWGFTLSMRPLKASVSHWDIPNSDPVLKAIVVLVVCSNCANSGVPKQCGALFLQFMVSFPLLGQGGGRLTNIPELPFPSCGESSRVVECCWWMELEKKGFMECQPI